MWFYVVDILQQLVTTGPYQDASYGLRQLIDGKSVASYQEIYCHAGHFSLVFSQYMGSNFPADFL